jgi:hypothetical protein
MPTTSAQGLAQNSGYAFAQATAAGGAIVIAPHQAFGVFSTDDASPNSLSADLVKNTLLAAGWSMPGTLQAVGSIFGPFGWGYTGFQADVVTITYQLHTWIFAFYDPTVGPAPSGVDVIPVLIGPSSAASQLLLITALNGLGFLTAAANGPDQIDLTAKVAGTLGNSITATGNGSVSTAVSCSGGGWILQSKSQVAVFGAPGNSASIILSVAPGVGFGGNRLAFAINVGGVVQPTLGGSNIVTGGVSIPFEPEKSGATQWGLIADDFGALFYCLAPFHAGDVFVFDSFLWMTSLCIQPVVPLGYSAFVMQSPGTIAAFPSLGASNNMTVDSWVGPDYAGSYHATGGIGQRGWSIGMYHSEGGMVADPMGSPVLQTPWVFLPVGYIGESRICGQLFDSLVSSGPNNYTQQFTIAGYNYRVIASQTFPPGSLFLSTGEVSNTGAASSSNPKQPSPTHPTAPESTVGLGNVSIDPSGYLGILVSNSATNPFTSAMLGDPIVIAGVSYNVGVYDSAVQIKFNPPPPAAALNVPYSFAI